MCTWRRLTALLLVAYGSTAGALAQGLPEGPITAARGTVSDAGSNPIATAAAANAVSSAASSTVIVAPSTPVLASRNACRVTATKLSSGW